jgi:urea transporter
MYSLCLVGLVVMVVRHQATTALLALLELPRLCPFIRTRTQLICCSRQGLARCSALLAEQQGVEHLESHRQSQTERLPH